MTETLSRIAAAAFLAAVLTGSTMPASAGVQVGRAHLGTNHTIYLPIVFGPSSPPLAPFEASVVPYGDHGNMASVHYRGARSDLEGLIIEATFRQNGAVIEENVPVQLLDGQMRFEMVDAKYQPGIPVEVEIKATGGAPTLQNRVQTIALGHYQDGPYIYPLFWASEIEGHTLADRNHTLDGFYAHDLCLDACGTGGEEGEGVPVHMPFTMQLIRVNQGAETEKPDKPHNYSIFFVNPYTGFVCAYQHQQPGELLVELAGTEPLDGFGSGYPAEDAPIIEYDPARLLTTIGPKDIVSGIPHLHFACQNPYSLVCDLNNWAGTCEDDWTLCPNVEGPRCEQSASLETLQYRIDDWVDPSR